MLRILTGKDRTALSDYVLREICINAADGREGQILIVMPRY